MHLWNWEADFLDVVEQKQDGISTLYYYAFRRLEQSLRKVFFVRKDFLSYVNLTDS